jgi:hypothetical protein
MELGILKLPSGSGGARPHPEGPVTASEQIQALKQSAIKSAGRLLKSASGIGDSYLHMENELLEVLDAEFAHHRAALKYLLATKPNERDLDHFHRLLAGKA